MCAVVGSDSGTFVFDIPCGESVGLAIFQGCIPYLPIDSTSSGSVGVIVFRTNIYFCFPNAPQQDPTLLRSNRGMHLHTFLSPGLGVQVYFVDE